MDMYIVIGFDEPEHIYIEIYCQIRVHTALEKNLGTSQLNCFPDFIAKLILGKDVCVLISGLGEKSTEPAPGHAHIGIVDVPVFHIRDSFFGMVLEAALIGHCTERQQVRMPEQFKCLVFIDSLAGIYFLDGVVNWHVFYSLQSWPATGL